jgi:hypothetical protein
MIKLILSNTTNNFFKLLPEFNNSPCVIVPDPQNADFARSKFAQFGKNIEVITMAQFLKSELKLLNFDYEISRKSDLILNLSTVFRKLSPKANFQDFLRSFNILTEFRSYSFDSLILSNILEHFDDEIKKNVLYFNQILDVMQIKDEHRAYHDISEFLRHEEIPIEYPENRHLIFWGFKFLTSQQIDFIQSFKIRNMVSLSFPENIYKNETLESDWIKYIKFDETITLREENKNKFDKKMILIPEGRISESLRTLNLNPLESDILLAKSELLLEDTLTIPIDLYYKISHSLLENSISYFNKTFRENLFIKEEKITVKKFLDYLNILKKNSKETKNFKDYAAVNLMEKVLNKWLQLTDSITDLDIFHLETIIEVSLLDMPRNYVTVNSHLQNGRLMSLKEINEISQGKNLVLIATNFYGDIAFSDQKYDEQLESFLRSLGPVRRSELDSKLLLSRLTEEIEQHHTIILIENSLTHYNLSWVNFLQSLGIGTDKTTTIQLPLKKKLNIEFKNSSIAKDISISATNLQMYLDCPRKYYLNYIDKLKLNTTLEHILDASEIGILAHNIIEKTVKSSTEFRENAYQEILNQTLKNFVEKNQKTLTPELFQNYLLKLKTLSEELAKSLIKIKREIGIDWKFEVELEKTELFPFKGRIDCIGTIDNKIYIFDFKTSVNNYTYSSIAEFENIQLWYYLWYLSLTTEQFDNKEIYLGYLSLNGEEMRLITNQAEHLLGDEFKFKSINFKVDDFNQKLIDLFQKLQNEEHFLPNPKSSKVCEYCLYKDICSRGIQ